MTLQVIYNTTNHCAVQRFCRENEDLLMYNSDLDELYEIFIEDNQDLNLDYDEFMFLMMCEYHT